MFFINILNYTSSILLETYLYCNFVYSYLNFAIILSPWIYLELCYIIESGYILKRVEKTSFVNLKCSNILNYSHIETNVALTF